MEAQRPSSRHTNANCRKSPDAVATLVRAHVFLPCDNPSMWDVVAALASAAFDAVAGWVHRILKYRD
jgi:hypothetical protein